MMNSRDGMKPTYDNDIDLQLILMSARWGASRSDLHRRLDAKGWKRGPNGGFSNIYHGRVGDISAEARFTMVNGQLREATVQLADAGWSKGPTFDRRWNACISNLRDQFGRHYVSNRTADGNGQSLTALWSLDGLEVKALGRIGVRQGQLSIRIGRPPSPQANAAPSLADLFPNW
jgi:hypothetical protein